MPFNGARAPMTTCTIIDTFPEFCAFWRGAHGKTRAEQIDAWASEYAGQWPELLSKQQESYATQGADWRQIAEERVFPFIADRLPLMQRAHDHLLRNAIVVYRSARDKLGFDSDLVFVLYVGIGCGAGWATTFAQSPAVLPGLEMIAECGWHEPPGLTGLLAHEIGHAAHKLWRSESQKEPSSGPWWDLYAEGFAKRCEHVILGEESWHEAGGINDRDWLDWCKSNRARLASKFISAVEANESVRPFFGSWFSIDGRKQCGYFLGNEVIRLLQAEMALKDVARLDDYGDRCQQILRRIADGAD